VPHTPDQRALDGAVHAAPDGALRIGAAASLASLAADPVVRERFPALALACESRDADRTLGDDLAQRGRCRYLQDGAPCLKNGGTTCFAVDGENRYLAIVEGGPSWIIHPSEAGVALAALDATIEIDGRSGRRTVPATEFFVLPTQRLDGETVLADDEHVAAVHLPASSAHGAQRFTTARDDAGLVLVSLAAVRRRDGDVRLVLGRVSPRPYRVYGSVEEETTAGGLDEDTIEGLAVRAMLDAVPLSENGYKLELAEGLLRDAIRALSVEA
jgi:xanthine dehydrogenase YagS FAD-binding subunit